MLSLSPRLVPALLIVTLGAGFAHPSAAKSGVPSVVDRWVLGGDGGWDYLTLDPKGTRLFISRGTRVDVVDTGSGKVVGSIPDTNGVHGIALDPQGHRGYTSNGKADSVTVFDLDTLKTLKVAAVSGHNPDAILFEPVGKHVFTFNGRSKDVTVLDAGTLAVVATLPVPDKPEFAVDDGEGHIYVNIESEPGQLVQIDSRQLKVQATWPLPGCASPTGIALDRLHHRVFSVCDGSVMAVTDALTGKQAATVKIGERPDAAAFDVKRGLAFSSNGGGTLTGVHEDSADRYSVAFTLPTQKGARTMALDAAARKVYLVTAEFDPAPAATAEVPHPRPVPKPGTFTVLVVSYP